MIAWEYLIPDGNGGRAYHVVFAPDRARADSLIKVYMDMIGRVYGRGEFVRSFEA